MLAWSSHKWGLSPFSGFSGKGGQLMSQNDKHRIGVYVCHCGTNISHTVDVGAVVAHAATLRDVAVAREYKYMCSDPGQEMIRRDIREQGLTHVVVASCSPLMHEGTFRKVCEEAGINRYLFQMANIREHCSWVHTDRRLATAKAKQLVSAAVRRVWYHLPLEEREVAVRPETLVVGAGIAGIEAALRIAESGKRVYLVEKEPSIGGHMAQFDKTFPTLDCAACILTPKMVSVGEHPNIELLSYSEVEAVSGYVGNFDVKIRRKARHIDEQKCTGCGLCVENCLVRNEAYIEPMEGPTVAEQLEPPLSSQDEAKLEKIVERYNGRPEAAVPAMHAVQAVFNYLPARALAYLSDGLGVSIGLLYRLATFYDAFSLVPKGKHTVRVCMGTACYVKGAHGILLAFEKHLGIQSGGLTEDKQFSLETVNCVGCCGQAPVVTIGEEIFGYMKQTEVRGLVAKFKEKEKVTV
jgi:NADH:ubiquinone oxidoreductase subunit E/NAD-dependent dihydropyrimidine dehydrogenase PreA subunit